MNHACTLYRLYGNYSHHYQDLSEFQMDLANLRQHALEYEITMIEEVHPPPPSSDTMHLHDVQFHRLLPSPGLPPFLQ